MRSLAFTILLFLAFGDPVVANDLAGRLELRVGSKGKLAASSELANAVISFTPASAPAARAAVEPFEIVTEGKTFVPRMLAVPVGSTVRFPNRDPILHNVFSVSPSNPFDAGLYGQGEGHEHTFTKPGFVRVFCNVHHSMVAHVLVLDTPFFVTPDADGTFALDGVPAGKGRLTVWHERADPLTIDVEVPTDGPVSLELTLEGRRVPQHLNKLGQPYRRSRDGRYD